MKLLSRFRRHPVDVQKAYAAWAPSTTWARATPSSAPTTTPSSSSCPARLREAWPWIWRAAPAGTQILLHSRGWERVFGLDLSPEMLQLASGYSGRAVADLRALPFRPVELVVCSLALGHLPKLDEVLDPLCGAIRHDGHLVITDLHPLAIRAGMEAHLPGACRVGLVGAPLTVYEIAEVLAGLQRRGLTPELVTEPAPENRRPGSPRAPTSRWSGLFAPAVGATDPS